MTLRSFSLAVLAVSVLAPSAYVAYFSWSFNRWANAQPYSVCGMPLYGAYGLALVVMGFLSLVAVGLGVAAFVRLPAPRQRWRIAELLLLALPFLVSASLIAAVVLSN